MKSKHQHLSLEEAVRLAKGLSKVYRLSRVEQERLFVEIDKMLQVELDSTVGQTVRLGMIFSIICGLTIDEADERLVDELVKARAPRSGKKTVLPRRKK